MNQPPRARSGRIYLGLLVGICAVLVARAATVQVGARYHDDPLNAFVRGAISTDKPLAPVVLADGTVVAESLRDTEHDRWIRRYSDISLTPLLGVTPLGGYPVGLELAVASSDETQSVQLLVDPQLQAAASLAVGSNPAALLVVRVDGSVLAAADPSAKPLADPNRSADGSARLPSGAFRLWPRNAESVLFDRPTAPGSTLKPLLVARAYDAKKIDRTEIFEPATGFAPPGGRRIKNYAGSMCPTGNVVDGLARSCNSTALAVASRLGPAGVRSSLQAFGFGMDHGSSRSVARSMPALADGWPSTIDQMSLAIIGQGDAQVTLLDLALAYAGLANGTAPPSSRFTLKDPVNTQASRPVSEDGARIALEGMAAAVDHGTARGLKGLDVLAKTGTATRSGSRDSDGWVVALYPADRPVAVIVVRVDGAAASAGGGDAVAIASAFLPALQGSPSLER